VQRRGSANGVGVLVVCGQEIALGRCPGETAALPRDRHGIRCLVAGSPSWPWGLRAASRL